MNLVLVSASAAPAPEHPALAPSAGATVNFMMPAVRAQLLLFTQLKDNKDTHLYHRLSFIIREVGSVRVMEL